MSLKVESKLKEDVGLKEESRLSKGEGERRVSFHVDEEMEEEVLPEEKELSYELYQEPPPEERRFGSIVKDTFGFYKKRPKEVEDPEKAGSCAEAVVHRYTLTNAAGMEVRLMTLGATILSVRMPDNKKIMGDVVLGFDTLDEYMDEEINKLSFGSVFGRYSSFISNAQFKIGKEEYCLSANIKGLHHFCGGFRGFDKVLWDSHVAYDRVIMSHVSPDGDEGYPGTLMVQLSFHLTEDSRLVVTTTATTSRPTVLSLGHNLFFNMAGHEKGPDGLQEHTLLVNADRFVKTNEFTKAPDGDLKEVGGSYFDLRVPRPIWKAMKKIPGGGYNSTFCLTKGSPSNSVSFASRLMHPGCGRYVEIMTDMPGLFINTGTTLPDPNAKPPLEAQSGFLEEHGYPQFCRDEKKMEEYARDLEIMGSQTWPRKDQDSDKVEGEERKSEVRKSLEKEHEEKTDEIEEEKGQSVEEEEEPTEFDDNFLKDDAESVEEEKKYPSWTPPAPIIGKKGAEYKKNGAVCLITQEFPDCMLYKHFPKPIIKPGMPYSRTTIYKFGIVPMRINKDKYFYL